MANTHRAEVQAILEGAHAEHAALLEAVSPALRASLPVDATGITQAIEHLAEAVGISRELSERQRRAHQSNPAVLHGRVFGRTPLAPDTVLAAFVEGARVRADALGELARRAGGVELEQVVEGILEDRPPDVAAGEPDAERRLRAAYAAQEAAALRIASFLDATVG